MQVNKILSKKINKGGNGESAKDRTGKAKMTKKEQICVEEIMTATTKAVQSAKEKTAAIKRKLSDAKGICSCYCVSVGTVESVIAGKEKDRYKILFRDKNGNQRTSVSDWCTRNPAIVPGSQLPVKALMVPFGEKPAMFVFEIDGRKQNGKIARIKAATAAAALCIAAGYAVGKSRNN